MGNPLVSIIIPTFARPDNLCRAIDSVLSQTYFPIEIIVVDDNGIGTTFQQDTEKLLVEYIDNKSIQYIRHEVNKNGSAARNSGTRASKGEIIGYLDDDDVFMPTKVEEQVRRLQEAHEENPKVAGVYCNIEMLGNRGGDFKLMSTLEGNLSEPLLLSEIRFNSSTIMLYRYAFDKIGGWDERFLRHQDWEFCIRFFEHYEMVIASQDKCLIKKYTTPNYNTANPDKIAGNMLFFLQQMEKYIVKMKRCNDIFFNKYFGLARTCFRCRNYKQGMKFLSETKKYGKLSIPSYVDIAKSIIRGYVKK